MDFCSEAHPRRTIQISTFLAVCIFNEGFIPILKILSVMGITIGPEAHARMCSLT